MACYTSTSRDKGEGGIGKDLSQYLRIQIHYLGNLFQESARESDGER